MTELLNIRPYLSSDSAAVNKLIRTIQKDEQQIDLPQPELNDIESFYQQHGNFWVAYDRSQLVGTVALLLLGSGVAKLAKMFVAKSHRGASTGAAVQLLEVVVSWAREFGVRTICLETIPEPCAAQRFYLRNGFNEVAASDLPAVFKLCPYPSRYYLLRLDNDV
jgi:N-acetylglutamate synthase-like GNAT family acetyltransferase